MEASCLGTDEHLHGWALPAMAVPRRCLRSGRTVMPTWHGAANAKFPPAAGPPESRARAQGCRTGKIPRNV